jgi:hypothetical protein
MGSFVNIIVNVEPACINVQVVSCEQSMNVADKWSKYVVRRTDKIGWFPFSLHVSGSYSMPKQQTEGKIRDTPKAREEMDG